MFNNEKNCLTWLLPSQTNQNFLKGKIFPIIKKFGLTDKLTIIRHIVLSLYGYLLSPIFFGIFDEIIAVMFMFVFSIINISIFLIISKKEEEEGLFLWLIFLIFKNNKQIKLLFLFIIEPFLFIIDYRNNCEKYGYFLSRKITIMLLITICSLLASITWSILIYYSGLSDIIWGILVSLF